ncbi:hypothetical protein [Patulibacter minatonensis]|uniref:hypothetical protein n=1 Tax=Patulibacter minatonensis TaxID=298163 RepID=UPI000479130A|nr:hypothetical protein [Patulibacter minatonensis]
MSGGRLPEAVRGRPRLGVPGGVRELVPGVLGATTDEGHDVLLVERPGAPDADERLAAARVVSRPALADDVTLAVARRWAGPGQAHAMPPVLLTASRSMAALLAVLVLLDLLAGRPVPLGPLVAVAAALALIAAGVTVIGRLGLAGVAVDGAVRVVDGPILDVARAALAGDDAALARLEELRGLWWTGPVDPDPPRAAAPGTPEAATDPSGPTRGPAADEPWRVREPGDAGLWATNQVGDAVYAPGVLGVRDDDGRERLLVAPPGGVTGWRRLVVLQTTGASGRLETDDRWALWFAVAPAHGRGARAVFLVGNLLAAAVTFGLGLAAASAADGSPAAWGVGAAVTFTVVSGGAWWWVSDRVVRGACRQVLDPDPDLRHRCEALRATLEAEGADGSGVMSGRRLLWDATAPGTPSSGAARR